MLDTLTHGSRLELISSQLVSYIVLPVVHTSPFIIHGHPFIQPLIVPVVNNVNKKLDFITNFRVFMSEEKQRKLSDMPFKSGLPQGHNSQYTELPRLSFKVLYRHFLLPQRKLSAGLAAYN